MNGYNFSERVRRVLLRGREVAAEMHHEFVGTEHLLLALVREDDGIACATLANKGIDPARIEQAIAAAVAKGSSRVAGPDLPYTSRAKQVIEFSMREAGELNHSYVGTEHLLLGILREKDSIAALILNDAGLTLVAARTEILRLLVGDDRPADFAPVAVHGGDKLDFHNIVRTLELKPHPEGGHYRELFRSAVRVQQGDRERSAITTIYYLLNFSEVSRWHVVKSDEVWHFYAGGSLLLLDYDPTNGALTQIRLGNSADTFAFTRTVAAGHWQAAIASGGACLMGCTVAPGFEFADFAMVRNIAGHETAFHGVMSGFSSLL